MTFNAIQKNTTTVWSDLLAVARNVKTLPKVLSEVPTDEENAAAAAEYYNVVNNQFQQNNEIMTKSKLQNFPHRNSNDEISMFFINGIMTTEYKAKRNAQMLSEAFNNDINLIYNPTKTLFSDVKQCIAARTFGFPLEMAEKTYYQISETLKENKVKKVIIVAYSQGGIIASQIIKALSNNEETQKFAHKIELYTFGNASNSLEFPVFDNAQQPHVEHFANIFDFVAQISVLNYAHRIAGKIFTFDDYRHSFSESYLPNFLKGHYGKDNKLSEYLGK